MSDADRITYAVEQALPRVLSRDDVERIDKALREHDAREWQHLNAALAQRLGFAVEAENYPAGAENASKLATVVWRGGMLYAINVAVLHALGLALGINTDDGDAEGDAPIATGLFLVGTDDPEGIDFDEAGHAEGIAKIHDVALPILVSSLEQAHERFAKELARRQRAKSGQAELDVLGDDAPASGA